jgi:hypothetical protein
LVINSSVQQFQAIHAQAEESFWANVADTAKLRAARLRSSDFDAYLEEVRFVCQAVHYPSHACHCNTVHPG